MSQNSSNLASNLALNITNELSDSLFTQLQHDEAGFEKLSHLLLAKAGINLPKTPKNLSLMASRLAHVLRAYKIKNYKELFKILESGNNEVGQEFISALTTNTTHWFREDSHFKILSTLVDNIIQRKQKAKEQLEVRIWCAAASTGQEVYTLSMTMHELKKNQSWTYRILGTDIDEQVLQKAASGCYLENELNGLSPDRIKKYFETKNGKTGVYYRIIPELSNAVQFAQLNLLSEKYPFKGKFDIIFCRNVFIYFQRESSHNVIEHMAQFMPVGGYLFLGHAEAGAMKSKFYKTISHATYERK